MEATGIIAFSILCIVFIAAFGGLIFFCYRRHTKKRQLSLLNEDNTANETVFPLDSHADEATSSNVEMGSVVPCDDGTIRQLLETEEWVDDVHGVIPHCIAILKMCREVTEKLVSVAMENNHQNINPSQRTEIVVIAKYITPRVDDMMLAITPPIDSQVLESRSSALIYAVQHLALLIRKAWKSSSSLDWIDAAIDNMEEHMEILRHSNKKDKKDLEQAEDNDQKQICTEEENEEKATDNNSQNSQL